MTLLDNCAVCLHFNTATEQALQPVYDAVANVAPDARRPWRPHVTLSGCDKLDANGYHRVLETLASVTPSFPVFFSSLGVFPGVYGTVFLAPVVTPALLELNRAQENALSAYATNLSPYYQIGKWVSHCTLASHILLEQIPLAVASAAQSALPLSALVTEIAVVQVFPDHVQTIYSCTLAAE